MVAPGNGLEGGQGSGPLHFEETVSHPDTSMEIHVRVSSAGAELDKSGGMLLKLFKTVFSASSYEVTIDFEDVENVEYLDGGDLDEGAFENVDIGKETERNTLYTVVTDTYNLAKHDQGIVRVERRGEPTVYVSTERPADLAGAIAARARGVDRPSEPIDYEETGPDW